MGEVEAQRKERLEEGLGATKKTESQEVGHL